MTRRVFLLMGLAIFAVVLSHAAGWGQIAMVNWTDRYRPVTVPNYDAVGSLGWNVLVFIRQIVVWAVPAFLFCSALFVTYAARGSQGVFSWKMARVRIVGLLIPYLIWSIFWFVMDALEHTFYSPGEYISRLIVGKADGGSYFFIPLLCQFYLLSPLIVQGAKSKPKRLLVVAVVIQLIGFGIQYLRFVGMAVPSFIKWIIDSWLFFMWSTYFALGLVYGFHSERIKQAVLRYKWILFACLLIFGVIAVFEAEAIFSLTKYDVRYVPFTFSAWFYSIAFLLAFVVFDKTSIPLQSRIISLGGKSLGIYLIHAKAISYVARLIRQVAPRLLAYPVLIFSPLMLVVGLAVPLLLMAIVSRTPLRRYYRYLFG